MGTTSKRPAVTAPGRRTPADAGPVQAAITHRTWAEHYAEGKALRERCPRKAHAAFSMAYADQNERDHAALHRAIRKGKVQAVFEKETRGARRCSRSAIRARGIPTTSHWFLTDRCINSCGGHV